MGVDPSRKHAAADWGSRPGGRCRRAEERRRRADDAVTHTGSTGSHRRAAKSSINMHAGFPRARPALLALPALLPALLLEPKALCESRRGQQQGDVAAWWPRPCQSRPPLILPLSALFPATREGGPRLPRPSSVPWAASSPALRVATTVGAAGAA